MSYHQNKVKLLQEGKTFITSESGNSMLPHIKSKQDHKLEPVTDLSTLKVKDIVFCKVRGKYYTHMVYAIDKIKGVQIGNAKGFINGWTKQVYGKVIEIL
jgi:hypothetical protein